MEGKVDEEKVSLESNCCSFCCGGHFRCVFFASLPVKDEQYVWISGCQAYRYKSIEELAQSSDIIAIVKVKGLKETYFNSGSMTSVFQVSVMKPLYGCDQRDKFILNMDGGRKNGVFYEVSGDPLLQKGEEYLVFARHHDNGTISTLGGPQGRFVYVKGKISMLNAEQKSAETGDLYVVDADVKELISEIEAALDKKQ